VQFLVLVTKNEGFFHARFQIPYLPAYSSGPCYHGSFFRVMHIRGTRQVPGSLGVMLVGFGLLLKTCFGVHFWGPRSTGC
jgi:hypothetical protein